MSDIFNLNHVHLNECHSTQQILKNKWEQGGISHPYIISTSKQTEGIGRRNNSWKSFNGALAFSFTYNLRENFTLTPLLIAVALAEYFESQFNEQISLKWPNDLLNKEKQKVGGILIHNLGEILIIGVGINLNPIPDGNEFDYPIGSVLNSKIDYNNEIYPHVYSQLLKKYELSDKQLIQKWNSLCIHIDQAVKLIDEGKTTEGIFKEIGLRGEAIIETQGNKKCFYTGSLRF